MTTGHVFIATSLDGYIARQDHAIDWLMKQDVAGEDHGYDAFIAGMDGLIMGSHSFRKVLSFDDWPYRKPVIVLSRSLTPTDVPEALRDRVTLANLAPADLMQQLAKQGWERAYVDGGAVIQSFLRAGLISDMTITLIPILLGGGRRLFGPLDSDIDLTLRGVQSFPSGLVTTRYALPSRKDA